MGVDRLVRLVYGVDVREPGAGGRSILDRARAGEFGSFPAPENLGIESALEELLTANERPWSIFAAVDAYSDRPGGAIAGIKLAEVWNRDTPRNLGGGLTEAQFDRAVREAETRLQAAGIVRPRLWLVQAAG